MAETTSVSAFIIVPSSWVWAGFPPPINIVLRYWHIININMILCIAL